MEIKPSDPRYLMEDFERAGGLQAVMKSMESLLDTSVMTANGKTLGENLKETVVRDPEIIRPLSNPKGPNGGIAILKGNMGTAVVKQTAVRPEMQRHRGPAHFRAGRGLRECPPLREDQGRRCSSCDTKAPKAAPA